MNEVEIPLKITGIGAIKAELRELKGAIADATDPEQMAQLAARAGELKDQLADANDAVNVFASGSKFEQVSNSLGGIKDSLMSLDFEEAQQKAQVFSKVMGNLNPADLAKGFKGFMGTLSTVGGAFVKLGATILANPIFLIVAVITAIVVAIGVFLKKIGVLDAILDALMVPINAVIQGFKDLTDWLGLTSYAQDEAAEKALEAADTQVKAAQDSAKARESLYNLTKDLSDKEIQALEERYGVEIDNEKSIYDVKQQGLDEEYAALDAKLNAYDMKSELSDEEIKDYEKVLERQKEINQQSIQNEFEKVNAKFKLNASLDQQIEMLSTKQIKNEKERAKAMLDIQEKEALAKIEAMKKEAMALGDNEAVAKVEKLRLLTIQDFARQRQEITAKADAGIQKTTIASQSTTNKEVESKEKKHLETLRKQNDNAVSEAELSKKLSDKEMLDLVVSGLQKELDYVVANKKKLYKTDEDFKAAKLKIQSDIEKANNKFNEAETKAANESLLAKLKTAELEAKTDLERLEATKQLTEAEAKIKMSDAELTAEQQKLIAAETAKAIADIDKQITDLSIAENAKRLANAQLTAETALSREQFNLERAKLNIEQQKESTNTVLELQLEALKKQQEAELAATDLTQQQKEAIEEKYRQAKQIAQEEQAKKLNEIEAKQVSDALEYTTMGLQATQQLTDLFFSFKKRKYKEGTKEAENAARQEFAVQKAFNLGMAVIDGAKAITSILAQYPKFDGGFAMAAALTSAGIASAVNIAKIAGAQFEGGGTAPTSPDIPTGGFDTQTSTGGMATPSVSLFGGANQLNNVGSANQETNQNITVTAIVSETEMTDTQNKINKIQKNAEL